MTNAERPPSSIRARVLYHQIHPVKLATDVVTGVIALRMLWQHRLTLALIVMFVPPIVVSTLLVARGRFGHLVDTYAGQRMHRMTNLAMAMRLFGMLITSIAAWRAEPTLLVVGAALIAGVWAWVLR